MHQQEVVLAKQIYADCDALHGFGLGLDSSFQNVGSQILILQKQIVKQIYLRNRSHRLEIYVPLPKLQKNVK